MIPREAKLEYRNSTFCVITPGAFVRCAVTKVAIPLENLCYWSVDRQEAYVSAQVALAQNLQKNTQKK